MARQGHIQGYLYDVRSERDFKERTLPPLPSRAEHSSSVRAEASQALVDQYPLMLSRSSQHQQQQQLGALSRRQSDSRCGVQHRRPQTAAQQGPRPYHYRVRQHLEAGAQRPSLTAATPPAVAVDEPAGSSLAWRRHIYARGFRAVMPGM